MLRKGFFVLAILLLFAGARAQTDIYQSQALYLYNFLRFIHWPENSVGDKFIITVYGDSPVYEKLVQVTKNRKNGTKEILVTRTNRIEDLKYSNLIFIAADNRRQIATIKTLVGSNSKLIVSENSGVHPMEATIEFLLQDNKLNFKIDNLAAREQNLIISQKLIEMSM
jgi:hypothetical protein